MARLPRTMMQLMDLPLTRVVIHGHEVSYRRSGTGPTVLLLHGLAGSSLTWRAVHEQLALTHDVIAPDMLVEIEADAYLP